MTRLTAQWIARMEETAADWSHELKRRVGLDYLDLAALAGGKTRGELKRASEEYRVAVVPITSGEGIIDAFSQSVAAIVRAMGFSALVTEGTDVNGIHEACGKGADILYMADDHKYIALNLRSGRLGDNDRATACGFVEILGAMAKGLEDREVAVLGYGIIGRLMAEQLHGKGARVAVYDRLPEKKEAAEGDDCGWIETAEGLRQYAYIADATSQGGWIHPGMLREDVLIATPGIPLSLDSQAAKELQGRYVHDLLEIGTACMLGMAL